ncbi:TIGR00341 family protein [Methanoplanus endosymbiosus]|uniref:TIGR00341 family protein n=1 Tax=Methanoplanus endosymbiosus TaxID=33865 RepID=A0A9E7PMI6_9EURY|nr:TIGR00341 family protein [Methanoplanus endosymbiosus]UUX92960.1 TIGR00341 family protein [Methanoplanus endosymbiosus]
MKKILINARYEDYPGLKPLLDGYLHVDNEQKNYVEVRVFVPDAEINDAIEKLRQPLDLRYKESLIVVSTPDFVISSALQRAEKKVSTGLKTPVEKLIDTAKDYTKIDYWYLALAGIAGLIALMGLFLNNVAIIIGAMLLSPILGPIHSFAIYSATGKVNEALRSIFVLAVNLALIFLLALTATFLMSLFTGFFTGAVLNLSLTEEIMIRTISNPIYIIMAVLLGIASIIALTKNISELIAGVAVAAALLPPTVVAGITVVLLPERSPGAVLLVLDNVIGLIAGALIATLALKIAPRKGSDIKTAKSFIRRSIILILILIGILAVSSIMI